MGTRTNLAIHRFGSKAPEETSRTGGGSNDDDDYADFYDDENFGALAAVTEYFSGGSLCEAAEGESEGGGSSNTWGVVRCTLLLSRATIRGCTFGPRCSSIDEAPTVKSYKRIRIRACSFEDSFEMFLAHWSGNRRALSRVFTKSFLG